MAPTPLSPAAVGAVVRTSCNVFCVLFSLSQQEIPLSPSHDFIMEPDWLNSAARLGIVGGTFDPIHYGHLIIAEEARIRYALTAVLFIPAGEPPHKPHGQADGEQRLLMVNLAIEDHPQFFASRLELDRSGPSYTIDTMRALRTRSPRTEFFLIVGADAALEFHSWREPAAILALARVVAASRPGYPLEQLSALRHDPRLAGIETMPVPGLDISSTALRARMHAGHGLRYLVPDSVASFIAKEGLYTKGDA